jgi:hypothetical protein
MVFLVFGPPLLDELSRLHVRRQTNRARPIVHGPISLIPDEGEQNLPSHNAASVANTKEFVEWLALSSPVAIWVAISEWTLIKVRYEIDIDPWGRNGRMILLHLEIWF